MSIVHGSASGRGRVAVLCICTLLFLLRVLGQLEVLLLAPAWLPPMNEWYSGLIPYPILLPLQIALLMVMAAVVMRELQAGAREPGNWQRWVRGLAMVYFAVMLLRLVVQLIRGADSVIEAGGIPVAFHWVLALFLLVLARRNSMSGRLACASA